MSSKYLPSKKFIIVAVIALAVGGILIWYTHYQKKIIVKNQEALKIKISALVEQDIDNDGVKDWEEALWGTDPNLADTDGNGISDGEEIRRKKEKIAEDASTQDSDSSSSDTLNETDEFAKDLFTTVVALKQSGTLNEDNIKNLADKIGSTASAQKELSNQFSQKDIISSDTTGSAGLTAYGKEFMKVVNGYANKNLGEELTLLGMAAQSEDPASADPLVAIGTAYKNMAKDIMKVKVPASRQASHLQFANDTYKTGVAVSNMAQFFSNPMISVIGVSQYESYGDLVANDLEAIELYFTNNGILKK